MQIRPVKITITTNTSSVNINRRFSDMISTEDEMEEYEASEESPVIFVTDGVIIEDGDKCRALILFLPSGRNHRLPSPC